MKPSHLTFAAFTALGFLSIASAQTTVAHIGFEAPDYMIDTSLSGQDGWSVSSENPEGMVIRGGGAGVTPPEGAQMLEITRQVGEQIPTASKMFASLAEAIKNDFAVSFLITADTRSNAAMKLGIGSSFETQTGAWVGLRKTEDQAGFGVFYQDGDDETWRQIGDEAIPMEEFVRCEVAVNAGAKTFSVKVFGANNALLAEKNDIPLLDTGGHLAAGRGFNRIFISADQHGQTRFYLDDIKVFH